MEMGDLEVECLTPVAIVRPTIATSKTSRMPDIVTDGRKLTPPESRVVDDIQKDLSNDGQIKSIDSNYVSDGEPTKMLSADERFKVLAATRRLLEVAVEEAEESVEQCCSPVDIERPNMRHLRKLEEALDDPKLLQQCEVSALNEICELHALCEERQVRVDEDVWAYHRYMRKKIYNKGNVAGSYRRLKVHIKWGEDDEFEVEKLLFCHKEDGEVYFLVKWRGWSEEHCTWEPRSELIHSCRSQIAALHRRNNRMRAEDEKDYERWMKLARDLFHGKKKLKPEPTKKELEQQRRVQKMALKEWADKVNRISLDPAPIAVENDIDLEIPPEDFIFINECREGEGVNIPKEPVVGCFCGADPEEGGAVGGCLKNKKHCCGQSAGSDFAYTCHGRVKLAPNSVIYECNNLCKCDETCPNRVVQRGRRSKLVVFRTKSKGWGVKAGVRIPNGTFVCEYVGEVITNEEAEKRGKNYDKVFSTYLYDLDFFVEEDEHPYTVDAKEMGNVSHFINHSCDPNLSIYGVFINCIDHHFPRIAMFANRTIEKGEEICFDYNMTGDTNVRSGMSNTRMAADEEAVNTPATAANGDACEVVFKSRSLVHQESRREPDSAAGADDGVLPRTPVKRKAPDASLTEPRLTRSCTLSPAKFPFPRLVARSSPRKVSRSASKLCRSASKLTERGSLRGNRGKVELVDLTGEGPTTSSRSLDFSAADTGPAQGSEVDRVKRMRRESGISKASSSGYSSGQSGGSPPGASSTSSTSVTEAAEASKESCARYTMRCQCGAATCRGDLFPAYTDYSAPRPATLAAAAAEAKEEEEDKEEEK